MLHDHWFTFYLQVIIGLEKCMDETRAEKERIIVKIVCVVFVVVVTVIVVAIAVRFNK